MYPMDKLSAEKQFECFTEVLNFIRGTSATVVAVSVDNVAVDRKFLTRLFVQWAACELFCRLCYWTASVSHH